MGASYDKTSQDKFQTAAGNAGIKSAKIDRSTAYLSDHRAEIVAQKKQVEALEKQSGLSTVQKKSNATGLPDQLKSGIENLSGHSMDDVKVHFNSAKPAQLNAHAFAQGNQIHIASGQEKHLPHEAWHVVQQKQGRVNPTMQMKGKVSINDDKGLEHEADVMGAKAFRFVDNRPEPVAQMKLQKLAQNGVQKPMSSEVVQRVIKINDAEQSAKLLEGQLPLWAKDAIADFDSNNRTFTSFNDFKKAVYEASGKPVTKAIAAAHEKEKATAKVVAVPAKVYHQCSATIAAAIATSGQMNMSGNPNCVWTGRTTVHAVNGTIPKDEHILLIINTAALDCRRIDGDVWGIFQTVPISAISVANKGKVGGSVPMSGLNNVADYADLKY